MGTSLWIWGVFHLLILLMLFLDLGLFHNKQHEVKWREALIWTGVWISLALLFNLGVYFWRGPEVALAFTTGYLIEKSLSVDNVFVFLMIFNYFKVPLAYQHKVLFWGILGALVMRGAFIIAGVSLIERFHWVMYVFGAFLLLSGLKMTFQGEKELHPERNPALRLLSWIVPVQKEYTQDHFFVKKDNRWTATPLFACLIFLETTDLLFSVDSIPAVIAVTNDPFIVYTSNVFAILGLRSLYFVVSSAAGRFRYLKYALSLILIFVGAKMLLKNVYPIPVGVSLAVIGCLLLGSVLASILIKRRGAA